jgi:[acyl-carrier-protein] S-malonyltransferase
MARRGRLAVLFPGQGSQTAGMREQVERTLPELAELALREVSDDVFERADDGTRWAQPAIFCAALAGWEELRGDLEPDLMAGHSLGEIAALTAAGALEPADGLRLVAARGRLMQEASEQSAGGMLAVRARDRDALSAIAADCGVALANDNAPDQVVLSGAVEALDDAAERLAENGMRSRRLPVGGAFHSPLMEPAVEPFRELVDSVEVRRPRLPVMSCVTAEPFEDVRDQLVRAIVSPVRWTAVLESLHARGALRFVETGPGKVLAGLARKTLQGVEADSPLSAEVARA